MYAKHFSQDLLYTSWLTNIYQYDGTSLIALPSQWHKKLRFLHIRTAAELNTHLAFLWSVSK